MNKDLDINIDENIDEEHFEYRTIDVDLDDSEVERGVSEYSYICGAIAALCKVGVEPSDALEFISNRESIIGTVDITKLTSDATVKASELASFRNELEII